MSGLEAPDRSPTPPDSAPPEESARRLARALRLSGVVTAVASIALGLLIAPALFAIAALGVVDFALARLFERGPIGPLASRRAAEASGDAATIAESDPTYNPYARED